MEKGWKALVTLLVFKVQKCKSCLESARGRSQCLNWTSLVLSPPLVTSPACALCSLHMFAYLGHAGITLQPRKDYIHIFWFLRINLQIKRISVPYKHFSELMSRKFHYTYSFVIQRITWKIVWNDFLGKVHCSYIKKNVCGNFRNNFRLECTHLIVACAGDEKGRMVGSSGSHSDCLCAGCHASRLGIPVRRLSVAGCIANSVYLPQKAGILAHPRSHLNHQCPFLDHSCDIPDLFLHHLPSPAAWFNPYWSCSVAFIVIIGKSMCGALIMCQFV